ncbi:MAG: hypothetical protein AUK54_00730 [Helicobacteraceae bacterium CG2_30_36_10]|nr:MAG: hypothetical protein AUK54_00730 [Helicobacteraceae bacterium CG2_30_36_10]
MRIFITLLLLLVLAFGLLVNLEEGALKLHNEAFERAMISFGLAKGLNAIISLIQGTEFSATPIGVGLTFSIGEVLDPFNDMVERFSWVMLASSVSLGIQKLLLILSAKLFLQVALVVSVVASLSMLWIKKLSNYTFFLFSVKVLILLFILRFGAILFVYSSDVFYHSLLQEEYVSSSSAIQETKNRLEDVQNENKKLVESKKKSGFFDGVSLKYDEIIENLNISKQLSALETNIEEASRKIISLITIFVVQTILMPLLFLWFLLFSVRLLFSVKFENETIVLMLKRTKIGV